MSLRPYQERAIEAIIAELARGNNRLLLQMATGLGKTRTFSAMLDHADVLAWGATTKHKRALVIAHREELLDQSAETIRKLAPHRMVSIEQGPRHANRFADVVVASIQTLAASKCRRLLDLIRYQPFGIVIVDEAHHAAAASYRTVLAHLGFLPPEDISDEENDDAATEQDAEAMAAHLADWDARAPRDRFLLGVTATPNRSDAVGLGCVFQSIAFTYPIRKGVEDGYLVPIVPWVVDTSVSLDGVRTNRGDFNQRDLADAVNNAHRNGLAVDAWHKYAHMRPTLAFTVDVQHAHDLAAAFRAKGIRAAAVSGETPKDERRALLNEFRAGHVDVITNCMILTEGTDLPMTSCILHTKPTKSATLFEQMCLDDQTQILTEKGWRGIDDPIDSRVAAFDMSDGTVHWSDAPRVEYLRGREQMWGVSNPHLDIRVTGGHQMVIKTRRNQQWRLRPAESLPQESTVPVCGVQQVDDADISDADITFLGLLLTDGNYSRSTRGVSLFQSDRYPDVVQLIRDTLESCGMKNTESVSTKPSNFGPRQPLRRWTISFGAPRGTKKHLRGWGYLGAWVSPDGKKVLTDKYETLSARQVRVLVNAMHAGDGIKRTSKDWVMRTLSICANHQLADQMQSLCVRRGLRCNQSARTESLAMLHVSAGRSGWNIVRHAADTRPSWAVVPSLETERVWCVTVDTGAIITRRNGKVAVVGNTGRGLRLHDGKADCIVIDLVDVARKHSLMTAPVLYGLPPGLSSTKGKTLTELAEAWDAFVEAHPGINVEKLGRVAIEQLKVKATTFNVWEVPSLGAFGAGRAMQWVKVSADSFRLQYPWQDGTEVVSVAPDLLGKYAVSCTFRPAVGPVRQRTLVADAASAVEGADFAERWILAERPDVRRLTDKGAKWRRDPASERQKAALRWRKIPHSDDIRKGDAADLLNLARARSGQ